MKRKIRAGLMGACLLAFTSPASADESPTESAAFTDGHTDRMAWEAWFAGLSGDMKAGADYWAAERSKPKPGPCALPSGPTTDDWISGCQLAKKRLTPTDRRRRTEADYKAGWNAPIVASTATAGPTVALLSSSNAEPPPSRRPAAPAPVQDEKVISQWAGSSMMTTRPFHVDGPWEIQWAAGGGYFSIELLPLSGGAKSLIANQTRSSSSSSFVPQGGDYYLKIEGDRQWSIRLVAIDAPPRYSRSPDAGAVQGGAFPVGSPSATKDDEDTFLDIITAAAARYKGGQTELQQGAARPMRASALCSLLRDRTATGWNGTIKTLSTNGDGKGVLAIALAPNVTVKTWSNSFSDMMDHTLIDPASNLFHSLEQLRVGQKVRFSAHFLASPVDCLKELSMTLDGSMTDPEFLLRFDRVTPAD